MSNKYTTELFIEKAKKKHGDKYDYSNVIYIKARIKVIIICKIHGKFQQTPDIHLRSTGCNICGKIQAQRKCSSNTEEFIEKAKEIHGDIYDYSKVNYNNRRTKICIICKIHGEFKQTPNDHLTGCGCKKCSGVYRCTTNEFIEKAIKIHGDKYNYSNVNYINTKKSFKAQPKKRQKS